MYRRFVRPETPMPTFVTLTNYTQAGIETLSELEADEFLAESREVIRAHGGELVDYYLTLGQYDAVVITEFPDAEAGTQALLSLLQEGVAETETLLAFTEDETRELIANL